MGKNRSKKKKRPRRHQENVPADKQPRAGFTQTEILKKRFRWSFDSFDNYQWSDDPLSVEILLKIISKLKGYEEWTWGQIEADKKRNHFCELEDSTNKKPLKRLKSQGYKKTEMFSLRLNGTMRLYGYRDQALFGIIWIDPLHRVFPSTLKHT